MIYCCTIGLGPFDRPVAYERYVIEGLCARACDESGGRGERQMAIGSLEANGMLVDACSLVAVGQQQISHSDRRCLGQRQRVNRIVDSGDCWQLDRLIRRSSF